jgi:hypothetical protein
VSAFLRVLYLLGCLRSGRIDEQTKDLARSRASVDVRSTSES